MLWLLLLLVWVALLVTNVGLVMLLGELGTTLALLSVWLADEVDMLICLQLSSESELYFLESHAENQTICYAYNNAGYSCMSLT